MHLNTYYSIKRRKWRFKSSTHLNTYYSIKSPIDDHGTSYTRLPKSWFDNVLREFSPKISRWFINRCLGKPQCNKHQGLKARQSFNLNETLKTLNHHIKQSYTLHIVPCRLADCFVTEPSPFKIEIILCTTLVQLITGILT